jgi:hypothetical protein
MKKMFLFSIIVGLSVSCAKKVSQENTAVKQETNKVVVGGDSDIHGCKASAGYRWSALKNKCVRLFEVGTQLSHAEESGKTFVTVAYVIFQGNKAELFLDTQNEPIILERKSEGDSWTKDDYQLIPWKGYVLKKGDKILYTGQ